MKVEPEKLKQIVEAALLAADVAVQARRISIVRVSGGIRLVTADE